MDMMLMIKKMRNNSSLSRKEDVMGQTKQSKQIKYRMSDVSRPLTACAKPKQTKR